MLTFIDNCHLHFIRVWPRFVMVARDAATGTKSAPINPLKTETPEERFLFSLGEKNIALRAKMDQDALFKEPPSQEESSLIHKMFLNTVDHSARSWSARMIPKNGKWMGDAKLKSIILCEPQHRNAYNKVFGGLIMEKCVDLALVLAWTFTGTSAAPQCLHVDDVVFMRPVEIGDLLYFHSQVVFTHENKVQTRVSAEVLDKTTNSLKLSNVLQITWQMPELVPHVVPRTYHEAMAYLMGRRHFLIGLENQGLLEKGTAEVQFFDANNYLPNWFSVEKRTQEKPILHHPEDLSHYVSSEEMFMGAEATQKIRDRERGAM